MNKLLRIASVGLLTALLLSACQIAPFHKTTEPTSRPADDRVTAPVGTEPVTNTTTGTVTDPVTNTTTVPVTDPTPPETDLPAEPITYPLWEAHPDIELLSELDGSYGELLSMTGWQDQILLSYARFDPDGFPLDAHARLLNVTTGRLSEAVKLPGADYRAVFLENGRICLYDQLACVAKVYDLAGNLCYSYESRDQSVGLSVDPTGSGTLWCYSGDSPMLTKVALDGSSVKQITVPDAEGGYVMGHRNGVTYYFAWGKGSGRVFAIAPDGGVTHLPDAEYYFWNGGYLYTNAYSYPNRLIDPADMGTVYQVQGEDAFSWIVAGAGNHIVVERYAEYNGSSYWVLDCEKALRYPALDADGERFYDHFYSPEEGVFCFTANSYDQNGGYWTTKICRWSYQHDGVDADLIRITQDEEDQQNAEIAARIKDKWGVSVIYTEPLIHQVASDYSTVAITDPVQLHDALLQLEEALSAYPEGFFDDLCYGDYTVLELYLCGQFTPLTSEGITTAEALSNTRGSAMVIGFNIGLMDGEYVRVLAHELLHIMERRIDGIDVDALAEWISLTPGGHDAYYYSYHDENGNEMNDQSNTYYFESDPAYAYFVDAYSKSFPTEDRARIFEKLVESGGDPYFADSPVMMAKARALCRIIREYFPSVAALERASWEVD